MRGQLKYLIEAAGRPDITIQVLPFSAGWHPAMYGMFNIYRFPDDAMPDVVYSEGLTSAYYLNKPDESARYTEALDRMCAQAATPEGARAATEAPHLTPVRRVDEARAARHLVPTFDARPS